MVHISLFSKYGRYMRHRMYMRKKGANDIYETDLVYILTKSIFLVYFTRFYQIFQTTD